MRLGKRLRAAILGISSLIAIGVIAFVVWAINPSAPTPRALAALGSSENAADPDATWLSFLPHDGDGRTGFIFYPGGHVDPRAYASLASGIRTQGYAVFIVPMPLHLAVFGPDRAGEVISGNPRIEHWVIGGHSLGGAMAARYAARNRDQVEGLILLASYPAGSDDLSQSDLVAISIYATQDGLTTLEDIENARMLLPPDALFFEIPGGNHAQFGDYGPQPGDREASIPVEEQQAMIIQAIVRVMATIDDRIH
jgi:dienelactone hydrolase